MLRRNKREMSSFTHCVRAAGSLGFPESCTFCPMAKRDLDKRERKVEKCMFLNCRAVPGRGDSLSSHLEQRGCPFCLVLIVPYARASDKAR